MMMHHGRAIRSGTEQAQQSSRGVVPQQYDILVSGSSASIIDPLMVSHWMISKRGIDIHINRSAVVYHAAVDDNR
jgi:hypothetical protein